MTDFDVFDDGVGNHIVIELLDGYPGRGLVCPYGSTLHEDIEAFSRTNMPDGYGVMPPSRSVAYALAHGLIGAIHDGEVLSYGNDPYLCS